MPPPSQPKRGLQPSIISRLIDPESAGTAMMTGYTVEQMKNAVVEDLNELLNTVHTARDVPEEFPEVRDSILSYGLPDLASVEAISPEQRAGIGKAIERAVKRFEPRLKNVRVTLIKPEEDAIRRSIKFRVDARLTVDPAPDVAFDTILEMGSTTYVVKHAE
jgi:type VI secretion system protein ImpF